MKNIVFHYRRFVIVDLFISSIHLMVYFPICQQLVSVPIQSECKMGRSKMAKSPPPQCTISSTHRGLPGSTAPNMAATLALGHQDTTTTISGYKLTWERPWKWLVSILRDDRTSISGWLLIMCSTAWMECTLLKWSTGGIMWRLVADVVQLCLVLFLLTALGNLLAGKCLCVFTWIKTFRRVKPLSRAEVNGWNVFALFLMKKLSYVTHWLMSVLKTDHLFLPFSSNSRFLSIISLVKMLSRFIIWSAFHIYCCIGDRLLFKV